MINKVQFIGRLGKDPEINRLDGGKCVAKFSLATSDNYKDKLGEWQESTEWHNIVVWGDLAERVEKNLRKSALAYVEGKVTYRKYTDKDGVERNVTDIVAAVVRGLEKKEATTEQPNAAPAAPFPTTNKNTAPDPIGGGDLPF